MVLVGANKLIQKYFLFNYGFIDVQLRLGFTQLFTSPLVRGLDFLNLNYSFLIESLIASMSFSGSTP